MKRGRPAGLMTKRRQEVLAEYEAAARRGERISWAELARRCGLYSYREARRAVSDLRTMGVAV